MGPEDTKVQAHSTVTQRTREVGIRMALGARRSDISTLVIGTGAKLAATGVAIGVVAAMTSTQLLSGLLFGVRAHERDADNDCP